MTEEYIRKQDAVDMCGGYGCLAHLMSTIKPADVVQVVHSQWKYKCGEVQCPECGNRIHRIDLSGFLNFCPNCGVKMDGGKK